MQHIATDDLLIRCLSHDKERMAGVRLQNLTGAEWDALLELADRQQCSPQLFRSLDAPELAGAVPEGALEALRKTYSNNVGRNLRLYRELRHVLASLRPHDAPVILLKGGYLAHFVYGDIGARYMCDLDLMVHYHHVQALAETLVAHGYEPIKEFTLGPTPPPTHHLPRFMKGRSLGVEVHWTIGLTGDAISVDTEQLWARSIPVSFNGIDAFALSPADMLVHLCVHAAYNHKFTMGLRPYLDIAETIRSLDARLDWEEVLQRAEEWGSRRGTYLVLRLAGELIGAAVPASALRRLRPEDCEPSILRAAKTQIFADKVLDRTALPKLADLRVRGSVGGTLKAMWRRLFPSFEYMSWHYPVVPGSPKVVFYYLVRWKEGLPSYGRIMARLLRGDASAARWAESRSKLSNWLAGAG